MRPAPLLVAVAATLALLSGCGGGGTGQRTTKTATASTLEHVTPGVPPRPRMPLTAAERDLERALRSGDCRALAARLTHSGDRGPGAKPSDPPGSGTCRRLAVMRRGILRGFAPVGVREIGSVGIVDARGISTAWAVERDGTWRAVAIGRFGPQIGTRPADASAFERTATHFVRAIRDADCDTFWRLLHPASLLVVARRGNQVKLCNQMAEAYRVRDNALHDIAADPSAKPKQLAATRDMAFFGLRLSSGRYVLLVLWTKPSGALPYAAGHVYPSVVDFLTLTPASG